MIIPIILLFSYVLSIQLIFYPALFAGVIFNNIKSKIKIDANISYFILFTIMFLMIIFLLDLFRNATTEFIILNIRYYYGIGFVVIFFKLTKNIVIGRYFFWIIVFIGLYESFTLNILQSYPFYWNYSGYEINFLLERVTPDEYGIRRILGPAFNSSISGSIYVIMLFFILSQKYEYRKFSMEQKILILLFIICILLSSSTMAYIILIIGSIVHFRHISSIYIILITLLLSSYFYYTFNYQSVYGVIWHNKIHTFIDYSGNYIYSLSDFILGLPTLTDIYIDGRVLQGIDFIGGDFILINQLVLNGSIATFIFIIFLFRITPKQNRFYLFLGFIATLHYGVVYSLLGQLFFGAIIANKVKLTK
ncbi:hypothetical protein OAK48_00300 [Deltaproteobacteria bacterium]|nr:hypothetical protein [Deltaproteobacteria bacterium]